MNTNPWATATRILRVGDRDVLTDQEGYLRDLDDWSEAFAEAAAAQEGLLLNAAHWEVIRFIRDFYAAHQVQAQVRDMIRHFSARWGRERGDSRALHALFPNGGPQKQGNRLAGIRRTKGEH
jgi:TusE/DsrC/DsvC family sulfur relay protein